MAKTADSVAPKSDIEPTSFSLSNEVDSLKERAITAATLFENEGNLVDLAYELGAIRDRADELQACANGQVEAIRNYL
jgi:hypothetical protein